MTLEKFMKELQKFRSPQVFNPWGEYDERYDIHKRAAFIRRRQLESYLKERIHRAKYILIAEAVGYQGGRFSGIAMTCERMLLGHHKDVKPHMICAALPLERTSNPRSMYIDKDIQKEKGFNEPTDTIVWGAMLEANIDPYDVILWNIFPFHPLKGEQGLTNRTPTPKELTIGWGYTQSLLSLLPEVHILGIGQKSGDTLQSYGVDVKTVLRHPANGGAKLYKEQFRAYCAKNM